MNKFIVLLLAFFLTTVSQAQKIADPELKSRLDTYMRLTHELRFEELMDYTHPSIFGLMPREQLVSAMREAFDNERMSMTIDSARATTVSPDFVVKNIHYKKVDYTMLVQVHFKDTSLFDKPDFVPTISAAFQKSFEGGTVTFDPVSHNFFIRASSLMMAIKDSPAKPWLFLGYQKDSTLIHRLYPQEVITHFKLL